MRIYRNSLTGEFKINYAYRVYGQLCYLPFNSSWVLMNKKEA